jgi:hypothetical protein
MAGTTTYYGAVEPKLTSVEDRSLNILRASSGLMVRIMDLSGIPIRIHIDTKFKKIYFRSNSKNDKLKTFLDKKYIVLFKDLMTNFFPGEAFLYAVLKDDKLWIYDIYTNSNWFNYEDLITIRDEYRYGEDGMEVLEPVKIGCFTQLEFFKLFTEIYEKDPKKNGRIHIIPHYNIVTATNYLYQGKNGYNGFGIPETEELLYSDYVAPPASQYGSHWPGGKYYDGYEYEDDYSNSWWDKREEDQKKKTPSETLINDKDLKELEVLSEEDFEITPHKEITLEEILPFEILTKEERKHEYKQAYANIKSFFVRKNNAEPTQTDNHFLMLISYLWGVWSNYHLRPFILNFLSSEEGKEFKYLILNDKANGYTKLFMTLWEKYNMSNINRLSVKAKVFYNSFYIRKIMQEEFAYYDAVFSETLKTVA